MVSFNVLVALFLATTACAAPVEAGNAELSAAQDLNKRGDVPGDVWVCYDYDWQGKCSNFIVPVNGCVNFQDYYPFRPEDLPAGSGRRTPRSIGPAHNMWCLVYRDFWCHDQFGGTFSNPGFNRIDGVKSIHCWY
ncbi:uncharacterized protein DFL_006523 [Arthrobotrys flagrans]|uniref:Uncharacterized protein n=1 Tax=Arthrobotrys flagrans TaxID=97331 RepID=A0A437A0K4_ARTFL|nr:hypothetical protein DFL_006523 [Arthrobotrys flagrans]